MKKKTLKIEHAESHSSDDGMVSDTTTQENEVRLHHATELLEVVTKGANVIVAAVDRDYRYTFFNETHRQELKRLTGKDTKIGMSLMEALVDMPDQQKIALDLWGRALKGETISRILEFGNPGRYRRFYNTRHTPIRNSSGEIIGAGEITADITELMQAQAAQRESEERFRVIAMNTPDHILVQDLELRYVFVANPQLGMTEKDIIGKTDHDILTKDDADALTEIKRRVIETGSPANLVVPLVDRVGNQQFFDGVYIPKHDAQGRADGLIGYFRNVTAKKKAEDALRNSESTIRGILDATQESIWLFAADGVVLQANPIALARIGKSAKETIGKRMEEIIPPGLAQSRMDRLREVVESGRPVEFEDERAGFSFLHSFYPVFGDSGRVKSVVSFSRDITERKRAEENLVRQAEQLKAANEDMARFNRVAVNRELRMIELKKKVNELCARLGEPPCFSIEFEQPAPVDAKAEMAS